MWTDRTFGIGGLLMLISPLYSSLGSIYTQIAAGYALIFLVLSFNFKSIFSSQEESNNRSLIEHSLFFYKFFMVLIVLSFVVSAVLYESGWHVLFLLTSSVLAMLSVMKDRGDVRFSSETSKHLTRHVRRTLLLMILSFVGILVSFFFSDALGKVVLFILLPVMAGMVIYPPLVYVKVLYTEN